ncbi:unnamed protein product [Agarophyton chilense]
MHRYSASRLRYLLAFLAFLATILVQSSISTKRSEVYASFFFEQASPESLSVRNNRLSRREIQIVKNSISALSRVLIDRYVTWHNSIVTKVQKGELDGSAVRTLVFVGHEGGHGLGDRLRGLLLAYLCAVMSDRLLLIHWQDPFPLSSVLVNNLGSNFTYDEALFPSRLKKDGQPDVKKVRKASLQDLHFFFGSKGYHTKIMFACEPPPSFEGLFNATKKFPSLATSIELEKIMPFRVPISEKQFFPLVFKVLFRPSRKLRNMMKETVDKPTLYSPSRLWTGGLLKRIDISKPFIALHARLGYGLGEYIKRFENQMEGRTMESIANCMARKAMILAEQEKVTNPPRFYLACDTTKFRLLLKRALLRMDGRTQVMYGTWEIKHVRDMVERTKNDLKLFMYTFIDLYVLSKGKAILRGNSGFPNLAIWMGAVPSEIYFDIGADCDLV